MPSLVALLFSPKQSAAIAANIGKITPPPPKPEIAEKSRKSGRHFISADQMMPTWASPRMTQTYSRHFWRP